jgi:tetratricopeptide (TPR) repeat protein
MSKGITFFSLFLLVELLVCGFLFYKKSLEPTPPVPNLSVVDELTRADLQSMIAETQSPEDWHWLALAYMSCGYFSEATATFERASELSPESAQVAFDYGFCLSRIGAMEESNRQFEKAIELKYPDAADAMYFIGRNYLRAEDPEKAEQAFRKAVKLPISKFELAKILYRNGDLDEAEALLKEVVRSERGTLQTFVLRSQIAQKRGDRLQTVSQSVETDGKWVRIKTPFGDERNKLMKNYGQFGFEKAIQEAISLANPRQHREARPRFIAVQKAEWNPVSQEAFIKMSILSGRISEAIDLINERIERFGPSSDMLLKLGECYMQRDNEGDIDKAIECWLRGGDINTDRSARECYRNLATYYQDTVGDQKTSEQYQTQGLILYANEVLGIEEFEKALPMAAMATRFSPDSAEAAFIMGRTKLGLAKLPEAVAAFKRCLELDPTHGRAKKYLEALEEN